MKISALQRYHLEQAVRAYLPIAYPRGVPGSLEIPRFDEQAGETAVDVVRRLFEDESRGSRNLCCARLTLRLGNERYPNMKLVLQEFVEKGEYVFAVDAHDQLPLSPSTPGYEDWQRLRDYNAWVKHRIERRFDYVGLPTLHQVVEVLSRSRSDCNHETAGLSPAARILVADDDPDLGAALETILRSEGYEVFRACDGEEALSMIETVAPDLVVMDYLMPRLCGDDVCERLKRSERWRNIPVLLATTTPIELIGEHKADGFLVKPFQRNVLLSLVQHLLGHKPEGIAATA